MNLTSNAMNYTDLSAMTQLKTGSNANSPENLRRVAEQFESLFMNMMVKSMRQANEVFAEGNPLNTQQTRFYQDMYDNQMSVHLAEKQGVGLADVLMRQLSPKGAAAPVTDTAASDAPAADQSALLARRRLAISTSYRAVAGEAAEAGQPAQNAQESKPAAVAGAREPSADWQPMRALQGVVRNRPGSAELVGQAPFRAAAAAAEGKRAFSSPQEFTAAMLPMAEKAAKRLGVDPHYLVAQAALETGWGKSIIRQGDGASSHNLFGIKAHGGWKGDSASVMTAEYRDGVKGMERASFRSYASFEQSFEDYVTFLESNSRYAKALDSTENPDAFFRELQRAGYATDPQYARKISQIAQRVMNEARLVSQVDDSQTEGKA